MRVRVVNCIYPVSWQLFYTYPMVLDDVPITISTVVIVVEFRNAMSLPSSIHVSAVVTFPLFDTRISTRGYLVRDQGKSVVLLPSISW